MYITNSPEHIEVIGQLYVESFTQGASAQFVDVAELRQYLAEILAVGCAILLFEGETLKACLLYTPLTFDQYCPETISSNFQAKKCAYIAEIMVAESFRGHGFGKALLTEFFKTVDAEKYNDVFIRVWDQNTPALQLYEKMGFTKFASIEQIKKTPDGNSNFVMNKIYLHKPLSKVV